jgi:hypothetical protein
MGTHANSFDYCEVLLISSISFLCVVMRVMKKKMISVVYNVVLYAHLTNNSRDRSICKI